jgi:hypothetical protein
MDPGVEFVFFDPVKGRLWNWVFPPSATCSTITNFCAYYVVFRDPQDIDLLIRGAEQSGRKLEPCDSVNSLNLHSRPVTVSINIKKRNERKTYFQYLYTRPEPPQLMKRVSYDITFPDTFTVGDGCKQLEVVVGAEGSVVHVHEIGGKILDPSEKLQKWAHKTLAFSATIPPFPEMPAEQDLKSWEYPTIGFEQVKSLGEGKAGFVSLMRDPATGLLVAVKAFKGRANEPDESFNRELRSLTRFNHPCIQGVLGWYAVHPSRFIVTEFLEYGSLESILEKAAAGNPPAFFDDTGAAIICVGIILGLRFLHSRRIIHRDIKPHNILIDHRGYPQIADFGLTREVDLDMTMDGIGTQRFRAPEFFDGDSYTHTIDIYAMTLVMYRVITGLPVFAGMDDRRVSTEVQKGIRPKIPPSVSPEISSLFEDGWANSPDRPGGDEFLARLREVGYRIRPNVDTEKVEKFVQSILSLEIACL